MKRFISVSVIGLILTAVALVLPVMTVSAQDPGPVDELSASCATNPDMVLIGDSITWESDVSGGTGPYSYSWSGDEDLSGTGSSVSITYDSPHTKEAALAVTDSLGDTVEVDCHSTYIIALLEFDSCFPSELKSNTGYEIYWQVDLIGGLAPYQLNLSGDDGLSGTADKTKIIYTEVGTYNASVSGISSSDGQALIGGFDCEGPVEVFDAPTELTVSCSADNSSVNPGENVNWSTDISGGLAPFSYSWSGSDDLSGSGSSASMTYDSEGTKTASVDVTSSDGQVVLGASCSSVNVNRSSSGGPGRRRNKNNDDEDDPDDTGGIDDPATTTDDGDDMSTTTVVANDGVNNVIPGDNSNARTGDFLADPFTGDISDIATSTATSTTATSTDSTTTSDTDSTDSTIWKNSIFGIGFGLDQLSGVFTAFNSLSNNLVYLFSTLSVIVLLILLLILWLWRSRG